MAILDGPGFFRNTVIPMVGGPSSSRRTPFIFTSLARMIRSGYVKSLGNIYASQVSSDRMKTSQALIERETRGDAVAAQLGLSGLLQKVENVTQQTVGLNLPSIHMAVNPYSVKWSQAKRFTKKDTMGGSTFFHFANDVDQNNDILQCSFSGRTGNINTSVPFIDAIKTGANLKLRTWHELYNLTREGMVINRNNIGMDSPMIGLPNQFYITYRSILMPIQITLIGFFSSVLDFTESAESNPNMVDYSLTFTVTDTLPKLDDLSSMMSTALTTVGAVESVGSNSYALSSNKD